MGSSTRPATRSPWTGSWPSRSPGSRNLGSPQDREFFLRDAQAAGQLRHSSIVPIFEVGEVEGTPYIVSEFVEGVTLAELLGDPGPAPDFRESAGSPSSSPTPSSTPTIGGSSTATSSPPISCSIARAVLG